MQSGYGLKTIYRSHVGKALAAAGLILALSPNSGGGPHSNAPAATPEKTETPYIVNCNFHLWQVRSGIVAPGVYIRSLEDCIPEAAAAKKAGVLKGFVYNPSNAELEALLMSSLSRLVTDKDTLQKRVLEGINLYRAQMASAGATLIPEARVAFGNRTPVSVGFAENMFSSADIKTEADFRSVVYHMLKNAEDWHNNIRLKDADTVFALNPSALKDEFLSRIMNVRADYAELENIFKGTSERGVLPVSIDWFANRALSYSKSLKSFTDYHATSLERKIRKYQLNEFKNIILQETKEGMTITYIGPDGRKIIPLPKASFKSA